MDTAAHTLDPNALARLVVDALERTAFVLADPCDDPDALPTADTFAQIVCAPALAKVRWLDLSSNSGLGSEALRFLIESPLARGLEALEVLYWKLGPGDGVALASAPFAATMMNLSVSKQGLDEADAAALQRAYGTRLYLG